MTEANAFNLTFRYIDNLLSIINPHFANWVLLIYPQELEIKRNNRNSFLCYIIPQILHQWSDLYQNPSQKRRLQLCHHKLTIFC